MSAVVSKTGFDSLVDVLRNRSLERPNRLAYTFLVDGEEERDHLTYASLDRRARAIASLLQRKVGVGDPVLLVYPAGLEFIVAFFGCLYAGTLAVPAYPPRLRRGRARIETIVADARPKVALTHSSQLAGGARQPLDGLEWLATDEVPVGMEETWREPDLSPATLAFLQYTSGSTSTPKGVMVSHGNLLHNQEILRQAFGTSAESVIVGWLPLFHDMGLIGNVLQPLYVGARCVLMSPTAFLQRPLRWLQAVARYGGTISGGPSFAYELCARKVEPGQRETLDLRSWRTAFNGAEPVRAATLERFARTFAPCGFCREAFYPCYGLAEATLFVSGGEPGEAPVVSSVTFEDGECRQLVGCGRGWLDQEVVITDPETGAVRPSGAVGEIWVGGPSVAQGYWGRPEETERTFRATLAEPGRGPFLRTGDLGLVRDGQLFVAGRIKDLIIVRGRNCYPQDLELAAEESHPALRPGCSAAFGVEVDGEEQVVVACEVERRWPGPWEEVVEAVRRAVAGEHEVQLREVVLLAAGTIPKTSSGKIQRHACRAGYLNGSLEVLGRTTAATPATEAVAPDRELLLALPTTERRAVLTRFLRGEVGRLAGVDPARLDPAAPLGGAGLDSLSAVELRNQMEERLGVDLSLATLLQGASLDEVGEEVLARLPALPARRTVPPRPAGPLPLSSAQERIWVLEQLEPGSHHIQVAVRLSGRMGKSGAERLRCCFEEITRRHEVLRSRFAVEEGRPAQRVLPPSPFTLPVIDLSALGEAKRQAELRLLASSDASRPFDLRREPPLRGCLLRLAMREHALLLTLHHIAADGWSMWVLARELEILWAALVAGRAPDLPALPLQVADHALWERRRLAEGELDDQVEHWRRVLASTPPALSLPTDRPRPLVSRFRGRRELFALSPELSLAVRELGRREGATLFMTLLAAFQVVLSRWSGQSDVVVGTPVATRCLPETSRLIGVFLNTVALRTDLSGEPTYRQLLGRVRQTALEAYAHQEAPFERVLAALRRESSRAPLFSVFFNLPRFPHAGLVLPGLVVEMLSPAEEPSRFDLTLYVDDRETVRLEAVYDADLFAAERTAELLRQIDSVLAAAVAWPDRSIEELPLRTPAAEAVLPDPRQPLRRGGDEPVHARFDRRAAEAPEAIAAVDAEEAWTYRELAERSDRLAWHLLDCGIGREDVVAIHAHRSGPLLAAVLGTLKAGAGFMLLDPAYPAGRLISSLEQAVPAAWLRMAGAGPLAPELAAYVSGREWRCRVELPADFWPAGTKPSVAVDADDLAYLAFTSGTTGAPKGIAGTHRPLSHFLDWHCRTFGFGPGDRFSVLSGLSHDPLLRDLLTPLWAGAAVCFPAEEDMASPERLAAWMAEREITVAHLTPAVGQLLARGLKGRTLPSLRRIFFGAEALYAGDAERLRRAAGSVSCAVFYGTTETPQAMAWQEVEAAPNLEIHGPDGRAVVPVGRGVEGAHLLLLRGDGLAGVGELAEVCIRSPHLCRGYLADAELTRRRFVVNPCTGDSGDRLYRTGDLGRYLPDGRVALAGRADDQVKVRGLRLELAEVEAALSRHPAVERAVAGLVRKEDGDSFLTGWLVPLHGVAAPSSAQLRSFLRGVLPEPAIPAAFVFVETLPLTPRGKVDRAALPAPECREVGAFVPPEGEVEEVLAAIWGEALGRETVGALDDFFQLGGHSVLATGVAARIRQRFGVELPLRDVFRAATLRELAAVVAARRGDVPALAWPVVEPRPEEADLPFPLTDIQQAYWIGRGSAVELGNVASRRSLELDCPGLDLPLLEAAWQRLVERHGMLRAVMLPTGEQRMLPRVPPYRIEETDLRGRSEEEIGEALAAERERMVRWLRPTEEWPLFEIRACCLDGDRVRLFFSCDYLVADAWSSRLLLSELARLYQEPEAVLDPLILSFRDYVLAEVAHQESDLVERSRRYWMERAPELPPGPELPLVREPGLLDRPRFRRRTAELAPAEWRDLRQRAARAGLTPSGILLAAYAEVLAAWSKEPRFTLVLTLFHRLPVHPDVNRLVGDFTSTTLLAVDRSATGPFWGRSRTLQERLWSDLDHRWFSGVQVLRHLARLRGGAGRVTTPVVFTSTLGLRGTQEDDLGLELPGEVVFSVAQTPQVILDHQTYERGGALQLNWDAVEELFPAGVLDSMFEAYRTLLHRLASEDAAWDQAAPLALTVAELAARREANATASPAPAGLLHDGFARWAVEAPERPAVISGGRSVTYGELDRLSDALARRLRAEGVRPDTLVAVVMEKGWEEAAAVLAVHKAGAAYLPIDPSLPRERRAHLLVSGRVEVALTQVWMEPELEWPEGVRRLVVGEEPGERELLDPLQRPGDLAYVIFTSGSTGQPKGVMIDHRGALNTVIDINRRFGVGPGDRIFGISALSFDLSVWDLFGTFEAGGALVLPEPEAWRDPARWSQLLREHGATIWSSVPALMAMLVEHLEGRGEALPASLRLVMMSGDWIPVGLPNRIRALGPAIEIVSLGGATEASIWSILHRVQDVDPSWPSIPYGKPMVNQRFHVLDGELEPRPVWVPGHLYIGGVGLAQGYWADPALTAERFFLHPRTGERLYRTGDLGRYHPDGTIEFLGRDDFQVKLRGYRIELGEIEAVLGAHPAVREAVVTVRRDGGGRLVAYVLLRPGPVLAPGELRAFLREKLPDYMVPSAFVTLEALPLTANGKVDRAALPAPEAAQVADSGPRTQMEQVLAGFWEQLLGHGGVGAHQSFFELGGDSLMATRLLARVQEAFGVEVPLRSLFESPTIAGWAVVLEDRMRSGAASVAPPLVPVPRDRALPLSFGQQRLWFLEQLTPGNPAYHIAAAMELAGDLSVPALAGALREIARRHEALRTTFETVDGQPVVRIAPPGPVPLPVIDLSALPDVRRRPKALELSTAAAVLPFDLVRGPLFRITLLRLAGNHHVALTVLHHAVSDGWSIGVLLREVTVLYGAALEERSSPLAELPVQYPDVAVWQRSWLQGEVLERLLAFWRERLAGAPPVLALPVDRPRPAVHSSAGASQPFSLEPSLTAELRALSYRSGSTFFMTLCAAFAALLRRWTGQTDLSIGTPVSGRNRVETEGLIGMLVNTLVLRLDLAEGSAGGPAFADLLGQVREAVLGTHAHQDLPFEKLVDELQAQRDLSVTPLFQVMFALQRAPWRSWKLPGLRLDLLRVEAQSAKFDLAFLLEEGEEGLGGSVEYSSALFDGVTIQRLKRQLHILLRGVVEEPGRLVPDLPVLGEGERQQLLREWNDTSGWREGGSLHELFFEQVARTPGTVALVAGDQTLTYAELAGRVLTLARRLEEAGVRPEVRVGVCLDRSSTLVVAVLAVLAAGGAYVPMDPEYPRERLEHMLRDAGAPVVLTRSALATRLPEAPGTRRLFVDGGDPGDAQAEVPATCPWGTPRQLAYVIFTSGSTGRPKGVAIEHRSAVALVRWALGTFSPEETAGVLAATSLSFDLSVFELFVPLARGGAVILAAHALELSELPAAGRVTLLNTVPSAMAELLRLRAVPPSVRVVNLAGEALKSSLVRQIYAETRARRICNLYGPSEDTTYSTAEVVSRELSGAPAIGRPVGGKRSYVVDWAMRPVPPGTSGELLVGGVGLARGYLGRPELTAERFVPDALGGEPGARLYRTGDFARFRPDGRIDFLGRADQQVKVRGFRIELGEIEHALASHPAVRQAATLAWADPSGELRLVAWLEPSGAGIDTGELRSYLKECLPAPMLPSRFVILGAMPLTPNGKIDRAALPAPGKEWSEKRTGFTAPSGPVEETLCRTWSEVLRLERVGTRDNFFELGGDSILSIQIISRAARAGLRLTPKQMFQHQTVAELARVAGVAGGPAAAEQGPVTGPVPLTPIQRWFFERELPQPHHHNQAVMLEMRELMEPLLLARALASLLVHHDALRLRFTRGPEGWRQECAAPDGAMPLTVVDLAGLTAEVRRDEIICGAVSSQESLDLAVSPLLRAVLFAGGTSCAARLLLVIHHLVVDGVSWRILLQDLETACRQLRAGEPVDLGPKTTSFRSWALVLVARSRDVLDRAEVEHWLQTASRTTSLPLDGPADGGTVAASHTFEVALDVAETRRLLQEVPAVYRTQINDLLLTALLQAVYACTGERRLRLDLEGHGREELPEDIDLSRTVGWFTALIPVVLELEDGGPDAVLKGVKEQLRRIPGRGLGWGLLRYLAAGAGEELRRLPTAEVSFNYLGQLDQALETRGLLAPAAEPVGPTRAPLQPRSHRLEINAGVRGGLLRMAWTCHGSARPAAERLAQSFLAALRALIVHCLSPQAGGLTPSDVPLAGLDQMTLDRLSAGVEIEDLYPLSHAQKGLLFHALEESPVGAYLQQLSCTVTGALDLEAFAQAWRLAVERHAVLRTDFVWSGLAEPLQRVHRQLPLPLEVLDWRDVPEAERRERLTLLLQEDRERGFDPTVPPLQRLFVIRWSEALHGFVWSHHHLLLDGWSLPVLLGEIFTFYRSFQQGEIPRPEAPPRYRDYIAWLLRQDRAAAEPYWRAALRGLGAPTRLALDRESWEGKRDGAERRLLLPRAETAAIQAALAHRGLTLSTLLEGAWAVLLSRYSGDQDVLFGAVSAGRPPDLPGIESLVGLCTGSLPVRVRVPAGQPFVGWLQWLQGQRIEARQCEYSSLQEVHGWSDVPRRVPLFENLLAVENYPLADSLREIAGGLRIRDVEFIERTHYPVTLVATPGERLQVRALFDPARFDPWGMERMLGHLRSLLAGVANVGGERIADLPLLCAAERHQLQVEWSDPACGEVPTLCIHHLVEQQAARSPDRVALVFEGERLTYGEMEAAAERLAGRLCRLGVGPEALVGLCMEPSPATVVGALGVLKAGGAYLPLDPANPPERIGYMLKNAAVRLVVTDGRSRSVLSGLPVTAVLADGPDAAVEPELGGAAIEPAAPDNLAYVIFTSGSTGKPKGALLEHRNLVRLLSALERWFDFGPGDVWTLFHSAAFDFSVWEMWGALASGGTLVVVPRSVRQSPRELRKLLIEEKVTVLGQTPSAFRGLVQADSEAEEGEEQIRVRTLVLAGEAVHLPSLARWWERHPESEAPVFNIYGPTECTVYSVGRRIHGSDLAQPQRSPIGWAVPDLRLYVMDGDFQPVPVGVPGELWIGGPGPGRGYLCSADLTAEKFVPDPSSGSSPGARVYRSGDQVLRRPDGDIQYLGRFDHQVKVRGFRIELGEIAAALQEHRGVREVVVTTRERAGETILVAYVVPAVEPAPTPGELREFLKGSLPEHMIPAACVLLDSLPMNTSGKIDRGALPEPEVVPTQGGGRSAAPRTAVQETLAEVWAVLFQQREVTLDDDFFAQGGSSLLASRLISRLREVFRVEIPLSAVFESPTVGELARRVGAALQEGIGGALPPVESIPRGGPLRLSFGQERLWVLDRLAPGNAAFNVPVVVHLTGALDLSGWAWSLAQLPRRHEILRTTFAETEEGPIQVVGPPEPMPVPLIDLMALPQPRRWEEAILLGRREAGRPFDLAAGPLLRTALVRIDAEEHALFLTLHHIVADDWSLEVLFAELTALYESLRADRTLPSFGPSLQYSDFAAWQRRWLQGDALEVRLAFWRRELAGAPMVLDLPFDRPRPQVPTRRGGVHAFSLEKDELARLRELSRREGATLFTALLSAFGLLLHRYTGREDLLIGSSMANRNQRELEGLIGFLMNTVVFRLDLTGDPDGRELLERVRGTVLRAASHQELPFEKLVEELRPVRDPRVSPLFQVMIVLQSNPLPERDYAGLRLRPFKLHSGRTKYDLTLFMTEDRQRLRGTFEYDIDLFDPATIERMAGHFLACTRFLAERPEQRISSLSLASEEARVDLIGAFSDDYDDL